MKKKKKGQSHANSIATRPVNSVMKDTETKSNMQEMEMETLKYPIITTSISALLFDIIKRHPGNNVAEIEVETGRVLTYSELIHKSLSLVAGLSSIGVTDGTVIAVLSYNSQEAHLILLASLFLGAVAAPIDPSCQEEEIEYILKLLQPDLIFSEGGKTLFRLHQILPLPGFPTPRLIVNNNKKGHIKFSELLLEPDPDFLPTLQDADEDHIVTILFTSGSTGLPKGVGMPETFFLKSSALMSKIERTVIPVTYLMATSICWVSGLLRYMGNLMEGHRTIYLRGRVHEVVLLHTVQKYRINSLTAYPTPVLRMALQPRLFDYDLSSLHVVNVGGEPLSKKCDLLIQSQLLSSSASLYQHYAITELGIVSSNRLGMSKPGSCGKPLPGLDFKVVDLDSGQTLGPDCQGELCFRGDHFMLMYLKNPELSSQVFDNERWFHTGDLGYYDCDGFIYIIDRLKEFIRYKSLKISPIEIEDALLNHPKVKEAVAFGIRHPVDGEWPVAVVVVDENISVKSDELADFMDATALPEHFPRGGIYFAQTVPRSSSGKVRRGFVKEKFFPTLHSESDSKSKKSNQT